MQQLPSVLLKIKMCTVLTFTLFFTFFENGYSQPIFGYRYQNSPSSNSFTESEIVKHPDGGIVGIDMGVSNSDFTIFKLSAQGNMEWKKQIVVPFSNVYGPNKNNFIALKDSNFIVIKQVNSASDIDFIAIKFDNFGNVIWSRSYYGLINNTHYTSAFGPQGFVISDDHQIVFIDENGFVQKSFFFPNFIEIKGLINTGTNKIKIFGETWVGRNLAFFEIDTTGNITNSVEYSLLGDTLVFGHTQITKAPNGGTYSLSTLGDICNNNTPTAVGVFHFDSLNQLVWAKKIPCAGQFPSNINSSNNGCIITANHNLGNSNGIPMVYKLDSVGSLEWMKVPGDPSIPMFNYQWTTSIIPDSGNGWYCTMKKYNLHFFHLDSMLNGLCTSQDYSQTTVNIICTGNPLAATDSLVFMTDSLFETTQYPSAWFQYDVCTGILIDSLSGIGDNLQNNYMLNIFPNPSNDYIQVSGEGIQSLKFYDISGRLVKSISTPVPKSIDIRNLPDGLYPIAVETRQGIFYKKVVVNR